MIHIDAMPLYKKYTDVFLIEDVPEEERKGGGAPGDRQDHRQAQRGEMTHLTLREREFVSLGAAMGSNCISCVEHHIPASRNAGLTDAQIAEAIRLADRLRQVPARKTLDAALGLLAEPTAPAKPCCGQRA